ncbi:MAG: hypothetical protein R3C16_12005 [Hyphomonadaceae bacterium]
MRVDIRWVESEKFEERGEGWAADLHGVHGILVPVASANAVLKEDRGGEVRAQEHNVPYSASASACRWPASKRRAISRV